MHKPCIENHTVCLTGILAMIRNPPNRIIMMSSYQESCDQIVKINEIDGSSTPTSFTEVCLSQDASCAPSMAFEILKQLLGLELPRLVLPLCDKTFSPRLANLQSLLLTLQHCIESSRSVDSASWKDFFDMLNQFVEKSFASSISLLPLRLFCLYTTLRYFIIDRALFEPGIAYILVQIMDRIRSFARCMKCYQALCAELPYCEMGVLRLLREEAQQQAQQQYMKESRFPSRGMHSRPELWNDIVFSQQSVGANQSQVTLPIPAHISSIVHQIQQWNHFVQSSQFDLSAVLLRWLNITFSPTLSTATALGPSSSHAIKLANSILRYTITEHCLTWSYKDSLPAEHVMMVLVLCYRTAGNGQALAWLIERNLIQRLGDQQNCGDKQWRREVEFRFRLTVALLSHTSFVLMNKHTAIQWIEQLLRQLLLQDHAVAMGEDKRQSRWVRRLWRDALYLCLHSLPFLFQCMVEDKADIHSLVFDICHRQLDAGSNNDDCSRATAAYVMLAFLLFAPHCVPTKEHQLLVDKARTVFSSMTSVTKLMEINDLVVTLLSIQERMNGNVLNSANLLLVEEWHTNSEVSVGQHDLLNVKEMKTVKHVLDAIKPFQSSFNNSIALSNVNDRNDKPKIDYFSQLPLELLQFILSHLTYKRIVRLSSLNSHFSSAAKCEQLWQQLFRRSFPRIHIFADELYEYLRHDRSFSVIHSYCLTRNEPKCVLCTKKTHNKAKLRCCQRRRDQHQWRVLFQNAAEASADAWRKGWTQFRLCPLVGCGRAIKGGSNEEKRHLLAHQNDISKKLEKSVRSLVKKMD